ncbi:MAG: hypothetical protein K6F00_11545, partial [Lachnospiraceae bacterium]|nr:hypothetical protein [Lachnospiraceae bacterium]
MADETKENKTELFDRDEQATTNSLNADQKEERNQLKFGDVYRPKETSGDNGFTSFFGDFFSGDTMGDMVWNDRREPVNSYSFLLRVEGFLDAPCKSVRAFTKELDFEEIKEGGRNDYVVLKRKPTAHRFTLQVERYVAIDAIDPLQLGTELVLPLFLGVFKRLTSDENEMSRVYFFTGCVVTGKEFGALEA